MSYIHHIGHNVCAITGMPFTYVGYPVSEQIAKDFAKEIDTLKHKYLVAITANDYQKDAIKVLRELNFKEHLTFRSSHGGMETLTLWIKVQKNFLDLSAEAVSMPSSNCTVTYYNIQKQFCLIAADKNLESFRKINRMPICVKIEDKYIVSGKIGKVKIKKEELITLHSIWDGV